MRRYEPEVIEVTLLAESNVEFSLLDAVCQFEIFLAQQVKLRDLYLVNDSFVSADSEVKEHRIFVLKRLVNAEARAFVEPVEDVALLVLVRYFDGDLSLPQNEDLRTDVALLQKIVAVIPRLLQHRVHDLRDGFLLDLSQVRDVADEGAPELSFGVDVLVQRAVEVQPDRRVLVFHERHGLPVHGHQRAVFRCSHRRCPPHVRQERDFSEVRACP